MKRSAFILLVEDDQSMLNGMSDLFQMPSLLETVGIDYEIDVRTANNGQEALAIMADYMPDLIVSDIMKLTYKENANSSVIIDIS